MAVLPLVDLLLHAFPIAWLFGRLGCALIHDHPGVPSAAVFAVAFGDGPSTTWGPLTLTWGDAPRLDLGLIELVLCVPLALWCARRIAAAGPLDGRTSAGVCVFYGPLRAVLDAFRADDVDGGDVRFAHLTWGQVFGVVLFVVGVVLWRRTAPTIDPTIDR